MRRVALTSIAILMVCALVLVAFSATALAKPGAQPFKGLVSGGCTFTDGSEFGLPTSPSPTGLWTNSFAAGNVSHLGRVTMESHHPTPVDEFIKDGHMTLVAANGDKVFMDYDGTAPFGPSWVVGTVIVCDIDFSITGGTGRFADATGDGDMIGYVTYAGFGVGVWPAYWVWEGTIRY